MMSMLSSSKVDDPEFNWWEKSLPVQRAAVTGIYTDAALSAALTVDTKTAGDTLYLKMTAADESQFRIGHKVVMRDASQYDVDVTGKVTVVVSNGASSYIAVKLLEDDDNSTDYGLSTCDVVAIDGSINPEGGEITDSISYNPTKLTNYTGISRTSLDITRTALRTKLRTGDAYKEMKREALELHALELEKAFLSTGPPYEGTGANGKPERATGGLRYWARTYGTTDDYTLNTSYSAQTWLQGGETWLDEKLETIFRYGSAEKMVFAGSGALLGINRLAKTGGQINLTPMTTSYGMKVSEWITPFGVIYVKTHPLFSYEATNRNLMLIFEPKELGFRYIDDTMFCPDKRWKEGGWNKIDGLKEEFLTEAGLEIHHPEVTGFLSGVGLDNAV